MRFVKNTIRDFLRKYQNEINQIDLEILLMKTIEKSREFVLAYPEYKLTLRQGSRIENFTKRRIEGEPIAYIIGHKEFYGLDFKVNKHTLIPRPETELMVNEALKHLHNSCGNYETQPASYKLIDIGTGSGNIIISLSNKLTKLQTTNYDLIAIDISRKALRIAKQNAEKHNVAKKITFLQGDLLEPIYKNKRYSLFAFLMTISKAKKICNLSLVRFLQKKFTLRKESVLKDDTHHIIITANLPYLSKEIYNSCAKNVKNFEPKNALFSTNAGLAHYKRLLQQVSETLAENRNLSITIFLEISPEQKKSIKKIIEKQFPKASIKFKKDLAGKWRMCKTEIARAK